MRKINIVFLVIFPILNLFTQERNLPYFDPGFYYMLNFPVNVRAEPNLRGSIIGQLQLHERIEIISNAGNGQKIENVSAYWYKIRYRNNIEGYIWGGYIARDRLVFDIDRNGVNDYFYYRISDNEYLYPVVNGLYDVIIYINNRRITTQDINIRTPRGIHQTWMSCNFETTENNTVLIKMIIAGTGEELIDIFEVNSAGQIRLIDRIHNEY